jgi:hypothetical protein
MKVGDLIHGRSWDWCCDPVHGMSSWMQKVRAIIEVVEPMMAVSAGSERLEQTTTIISSSIKSC